MDTQLSAFKDGISKTIDHLKHEFAKLQTGRASSALVENIIVDAYGQKQAVKAVAGIAIPEARTIVIQPWDKGIMSDLEKALIKADIGASPVNEGAQIRINLPAMTEERRKDLVKIVKELAEEAKISIRQQRQEFHSNSKRDENRTEDEHRNFEEDLTKAAQEGGKEIDELAKHKEAEMMTV